MTQQWDAEVGIKVHQLIGQFAQEGARPDAEEVFSAAGALVRAQPFSQTYRAGPQRVTCLTAIGLVLCPPPDWQFLGAEIETDDGRLDLAWMAPDDADGAAPGSVLIDEIKVAGYAGQLETNHTLDQVRRYLAFGVSTYGPAFIGVRLLALSGPRRSVLWRPGHSGAPATRQLLETTPFGFGLPVRVAS